MLADTKMATHDADDMREIAVLLKKQKLPENVCIRILDTINGARLVSEAQHREG